MSHLTHQKKNWPPSRAVSHLPSPLGTLRSLHRSKKRSRACATMVDLSHVHQAVIALDGNSNDNDLIHIYQLRVKNKRRWRRQGTKSLPPPRHHTGGTNCASTTLTLKSSTIAVITTSRKEQSDQINYLLDRDTMSRRSSAASQITSMWNILQGLGGTTSSIPLPQMGI